MKDISNNRCSNKNKNSYCNMLSCLNKKNIKHFIVNTLGDHYYFKYDAHFKFD